MVKQNGRSFPEDYVLNDSVFVPRAADCRAFDYSDGDEAETYLADVMDKVADRSSLSQELAACIRDWSSLYHLSPKRGNLLRPFASKLKGRILEVGAGCGAVTRYLGETGAEIVALEPSLRRAAVARQRVAELSNVRVVCDTLQSFSCAQPFDVIVSIGVLEYAARYDNDHENAHIRMLEELRRRLSPGGIVILAIENKLGLKYFAGAVEDHVGSAFHGINNSYDAGGVVTFGRQELAGLLRAAGLPAQSFYYPCPDYKLPVTVLPDPALTQHAKLAATLMAQASACDPQQPIAPLFSLEQAWYNVGSNHLAGGLGNSFLVVAAADEQALSTFTTTKAIGWHYSVDRHPAFARAVTFEATDDDITIKRTALSDAPRPDVPAECLLIDQPFVAGDNWWMELAAIVNKPGWTITQLADWARPWLEALTQRCGLESFDTSSLTRHVYGIHLDATPFNMVRDAHGQAHFFDQEWRIKPQLELGYIVCRGLQISLSMISSSAAPAPGVPARITDIVVNILGQHGLFLVQSDLDRYAAMEGQLHAWTRGLMTSPFTNANADTIWGMRLLERAPTERSALAHQIEILRGELDDARRAHTVIEMDRHTVSESLSLANQKIDSQLTPRILELVRQLERERNEHSEKHAQLAHQLEQEKRHHLDELGQVQQQLERERDQRLEELKQAQRQLENERDRRLHELRQAQRQIEREQTIRMEELRHFQRQLASARESHFDEMQAAKTATNHIAATVAVQAREIDKLHRNQFQWPLSGTINRLARAVAPWKRTRFGARSWEAGLIKASRLFRPMWYLEHNPDVAKAGIDPLLHYVLHGGAEGRAPHPLFDPKYYLSQVPDDELTAMTPLGHYISTGAALGLNPHPMFDSKFYLRTNQDVAAAGMNPLFHYLEYGWREGRDPNPLFETSKYLEKHHEVASSDVNPLLHYLTTRAALAA